MQNEASKKAFGVVENHRKGLTWSEVLLEKWWDMMPRSRSAECSGCQADETSNRRSLQIFFCSGNYEKQLTSALSDHS